MSAVDHAAVDVGGLEQLDRWHGAPLLPSGPFLRWLAATGATDLELADAVGCTARRVYALRTSQHGERVSELTVEEFGIAVDGDPRLPARLYPELLDWS